METYEFLNICNYLNMENIAVFRICSDVAGQTMIKLLELYADQGFKTTIGEIPTSSDTDIESAQRHKIKKLLRKTLNFTPLLLELEPVVKTFTDQKLMKTPPDYEPTSKKVKMFDNFAWRRISSDLSNIYKFTLWNMTGFQDGKEKFDEVIQKIERKRQEILVKFKVDIDDDITIDAYLKQLTEGDDSSNEVYLEELQKLKRFNNNFNKKKKRRRADLE